MINEHDIHDMRKDNERYLTQVKDTSGNTPPKQSVNAIQYGGRHYKQFSMQPWDVILDWELGYLDGTALKYISRWKHKGGLEDINKAIHFLQKLIEVETQKNNKNAI